MRDITSITCMAYFHHNHTRLDALLHHPATGACYELQLLKMSDTMGFNDDQIASLVKVELLNEAELRILLGILSVGEYAAKRAGISLLYKAAQHLSFADDTQRTAQLQRGNWVLHEVQLLDTPGVQFFKIPNSPMLMQQKCRADSGETPLS